MFRAVCNERITVRRLHGSSSRYFTARWNEITPRRVTMDERYVLLFVVNRSSEWYEDELQRFDRARSFSFNFWYRENSSKSRKHVGDTDLTRLIRSIDRESSFEENKKKIPRSIELDKIVYHKPDSSSLDRVWRVTLVSRIYRRELIEDGENASRLLSLLESLRFVIDRIGILSKKDRDTRGTSYERS